MDSLVDVVGALQPRQMLADEIYSRLRTLIMSSAIPPGTRINIEEIARQLDVSATPVRESLARLESDDLVLKLPLKGYRTTELLTERQVDELYDLRLMIEPPSAARAAKAHDAAAVAEVRREVDGATGIAGDEEISYQELSVHDTRFHDLVLRAAGNETVRQAFARTHAHLHVTRLAYRGTYGAHTIREHAAITSAIEAGDARAAEKAMRVHIEGSRARVLSAFDGSH
ncbi:GntR family transcriptional regulator [Pseudolysinimonas sp.]|uniref:GntR family transcriptional regulator n=1 Tax=Pseudolysinimonas sp. TaxID=2680009 RepID=UPI003F813D64